MIAQNFFNGDELKTNLWFDTPNPQFGCISPRDLLDGTVHQQQRLLRFIEILLEEGEMKKIPAS